MITGNDLYLDIHDLRHRGWTEYLVQNILGAPDRWASVSHWRNFRGKRTYFLERVQLAEASDVFQKAYRRSIILRKITPEQRRAFQEVRNQTKDLVEEWRNSMSQKQLKTHIALERASAIIEDLRASGLRTPHR
jgi:hypothetical protein